MKLINLITIFYLINVSFAFKLSDCKTKVQNTKNVSDKCMKQLDILCERNDVLFTMWDSSSRLLRTGLTNRSPKDLGDYDLCVSIDENINNVTLLGKFCPLNIAGGFPKDKLKDAVALFELLPKNFSKFNEIIETEINSKVKSSTDDSFILTGSMCIPDGCTIEEFIQVFQPYPPVVKYDFLKNECITKNTRRDLSTSELIISICFGLIILTMIGTTSYHVWLYYNTKEEPHDLIKAFSILYNGKKLLTVSTNKIEQIQCFNGLRFISMLWVIYGHRFVAYRIEPHTNEQDGVAWQNKLYSTYVFSGIFAVDTFFFISGFLLSYGYFKQAKNMNFTKLVQGVPLMYLHRYLRLTPSVAALFFMSISFLKLLGSGPIWFLAVDTEDKMCKQVWWRYFLYIQNYTPKELCWTQTWYLSADMQMFLAAPFVLIPGILMYRKGTIGSYFKVLFGFSFLAFCCVVISIAIPYLIPDYKNDYDTHSRLSGYIVGIIGGIIIYKNKGRSIRINRAFNIFMWILVLCIMLSLSLYYHDVLVNPTNDKNILWTALYRPVWCSCILWIVFSCYFGYGGFINWFLSNPFFQVGARLSYSMYVTHGLVILIEMGQTRTPSYFTDYVVFYIYCGDVIVCTFISLLWTLAFESPMIMVDKMLFRWIDSMLNKKVTKKELP